MRYPSSTFLVMYFISKKCLTFLQHFDNSSHGTQSEVRAPILHVWFYACSSIAFCFLDHNESPTPPLNIDATTAREATVGISYPKYSPISLAPTNPKTTATAGSRYSKSFAAFDNIVYRLRSPMIANMLEVKTTIGFCVGYSGKTLGVSEMNSWII